MRTRNIRPVLAHFRMTAAEVLPQAHAAYAGLKGNADFAKPPVDLDVLKETTDQLTAAAAAAMDGGSIVIATRNRLTQTLVQMLRQLARYVESIAYDDLPKFISSGFQSYTSVRVAKPPLNQAIRRIDPGSNSGQVVVNLVAITGAHSYELRWASVDNGTTGEFTTKAVGKTRPGISIENLITGKSYIFQSRALLPSGFTDWSDSVTRMTR